MSGGVEFSVYKMTWKKEETWDVTSYVSQGTYAHVHGFDIMPDGIITHFFRYSHEPPISAGRIRKLIALARERGIKYLNSNMEGI